MSKSIHIKGMPHWYCVREWVYYSIHGEVYYWSYKQPTDGPHKSVMDLRDFKRFEDFIEIEANSKEDAHEIYRLLEGES